MESRSVAGHIGFFGLCDFVAECTGKQGLLTSMAPSAAPLSETAQRPGPIREM